MVEVEDTAEGQRRSGVKIGRCCSFRDTRWVSDGIQSYVVDIFSSAVS
jgi:hypothetical protein